MRKLFLGTALAACSVLALQAPEAAAQALTVEPITGGGDGATGEPGGNTGGSGQ